MLSEENAVDFRISGLDPKRFEPFFAMDANELARHRAIRKVAHQAPGFPCRVSLRDADPGRAVLLMNYEHLPVDSPYRASHAIYVSDEQARFDEVNTIPPAFASRLLALRAFDAAGLMIDADIVEGRECAALIRRLLALPETSYVHAHYAKRGCYAGRIERA
jgi:hypothetical protein